MADLRLARIARVARAGRVGCRDLLALPDFDQRL
jgi:hypothetical protein